MPPTEYSHFNTEWMVAQNLLLSGLFLCMLIHNIYYARVVNVVGSSAIRREGGWRERPSRAEPSRAEPSGFFPAKVRSVRSARLGLTRFFPTAGILSQAEPSQAEPSEFPP